MPEKTANTVYTNVAIKIPVFNEIPDISILKKKGLNFTGKNYNPDLGIPLHSSKQDIGQERYLV